MDTQVSKHSKRGSKNAPAPPVSGATRRIVLTGAVIALICAEAWSAPTLFALAQMAKSPRTLAWLLPAVLDTYAATSIWFGNNVPKDHPAHSAAIRNTRRALLLTVSANGVFHLLTLAGASLPAWVPIALLIVVMALPIYIADRLVHLYVLASGTVHAEAVPTVRPVSVPTKAPTAVPKAATAPPMRAADGADEVPTRAPIQVPTAADRSADGTADVGSNVVDFGTAGAAVRRNTDAWAADALPLYRHFTRTHKTPPNAPQLAAELEHAGFGTLSPSRARDIRAATEKLAAASPDPEADRAEAESG